MGNLYVALRTFVESRNLGEVFLAPLDVVFGERTALQPDLLFVRKERLSIITPLFVHGAPDLVIEVLSPSDARFDRETKREVYARAGVAELWYVDPKSETAEILNLTAEGRYELTQRLAEGVSIDSAILPGLALTLRQIFS